MSIKPVLKVGTPYSDLVEFSDSIDKTFYLTIRQKVKATHRLDCQADGHYYGWNIKNIAKSIDLLHKKSIGRNRYRYFV